MSCRGVEAQASDMYPSQLLKLESLKHCSQGKSQGHLLHDLNAGNRVLQFCKNSCLWKECLQGDSTFAPALWFIESLDMAYDRVTMRRNPVGFQAEIGTCSSPNSHKIPLIPLIKWEYSPFPISQAIPQRPGINGGHGAQYFYRPPPAGANGEREV